MPAPEPKDLERPEQRKPDEPVNERKGPQSDSGTSDTAGFTGGTQEKTRTGTDDAQRRSDTGAGL